MECRSHRIFESIRVRPDKVSKSGQEGEDTYATQNCVYFNQLPLTPRIFFCVRLTPTHSFTVVVTWHTDSLPHGTVSRTLVVTSVLTSADVSLTSGRRSPDETDGVSGSVTHSIFVRFTSNFVHLHPYPPSRKGSLTNFFLPKFLTDGNLTKSLTGREIPRKKGLEEAEI